MGYSGYLCSGQSRDAADILGVSIRASFTNYLEHTSSVDGNFIDNRLVTSNYSDSSILTLGSMTSS